MKARGAKKERPLTDLREEDALQRRWVCPGRQGITGADDAAD